MTGAAESWPLWFNKRPQAKLKAQLLEHNVTYQTLQQVAQGSKTADGFKWILEKLVHEALQFDGDVSVVWERSKAGHDDWWPPWFSDAVHAPLRALWRARGYTYDQLHGLATGVDDGEDFLCAVKGRLHGAFPYAGNVAELWENIKTTRPQEGKLTARALVCGVVWLLRVWQQWHEVPVSATHFHLPMLVCLRDT